MTTEIAPNAPNTTEITAQEVNREEREKKGKLRTSKCNINTSISKGVRDKSIHWRERTTLAPLAFLALFKNSPEHSQTII